MNWAVLSRNFVNAKFSKDLRQYQTSCADRGRYLWTYAVMRTFVVIELHEIDYCFSVIFDGTSGRRKFRFFRDGPVTSVYLSLCCRFADPYSHLLRTVVLTMRTASACSRNRSHCPYIDQINRSRCLFIWYRPWLCLSIHDMNLCCRWL